MWIEARPEESTAETHCFQSLEIASSLMHCPDNQTSFAGIDLRRLLADLCRVDDEFERISVLILLHQFQVNQPFGVCEGFAFRKSFSGGLKQGGCQLKLAISHEAIYSLGNLALRDAEIVNQQLRTVRGTDMVQA